MIPSGLFAVYVLPIRCRPHVSMAQGYMRIKCRPHVSMAQGRIKIRCWRHVVMAQACTQIVENVVPGAVPHLDINSRSLLYSLMRQKLCSPRSIIWNHNVTCARLAVTWPALSNFSSRLFSSHLSSSRLSVLILILLEIGLVIGYPADNLVIAAPDNLWLSGVVVVGGGVSWADENFDF